MLDVIRSDGIPLRLSAKVSHGSKRMNCWTLSGRDSSGCRATDDRRVHERDRRSKCKRTLIALWLLSHCLVFSCCSNAMLLSLLFE